MKEKHVGALAAVCFGALGVMPVGAHHSFAAYDQQVTNTITGTLKEFDWNAPHSGMTVAYTDKNGKQQELFVTAGAPITITKQGFKLSDFRVGSKVTLSWHPHRNGALGGELAQMQLEDGRVLRGSFNLSAVGKSEPSTAPAPSSAAPK